MLTNNIATDNATIRADIWIYSIIIIVSSLAALMSVKNIILTSDSITYALVSRQIISDIGLKVPMIWFDSTSIPINGTVPFLMHPPFFPIILALLGGVTPDNYLAAQLINLFCHVAISIFIFLLMKNLYNNKYIALLVGTMVALSLPLLIAAHHLWSESLFISLTVATVYYFILCRKSHNTNYNRNIFIAGICASAAILTRNAGIAILAVFFWEAFILIRNRRKEIKHWLVITSIFLPFISVSAVYLRNYMISGMIRAEIQFPVDHSYVEAFTETIKMIFQQFQFGKTSTLFIAIFMIFFIGSFIINANMRKELLKVFNKGLDLVIVFIITYTGLICISMVKMQPVFELRFMYPLVPFLLIVSALLIILIWGIIPKLSKFGIVFSFIILLFGIGYKTILNLPEFFHKHDKFHYISNTCVYDWLLINYKHDTIIASNLPYHLSFFGGYPTVILPHRMYHKNTYLPENMEILLPDRMQKIGSTVIALFNKIEADDFGTHLAGLYNKSISNDRLLLVYECADGVVYQLKE